MHVVMAVLYRLLLMLSLPCLGPVSTTPLAPSINSSSILLANGTDLQVRPLGSKIFTVRDTRPPIRASCSPSPSPRVEFSAHDVLALIDDVHDDISAAFSAYNQHHGPYPFDLRNLQRPFYTYVSRRSHPHAYYAPKLQISLIAHHYSFPFKDTLKLLRNELRYYMATEAWWGPTMCHVALQHVTLPGGVTTWRVEGSMVLEMAPPSPHPYPATA